jgi:hypothetical protein
VPVRGTGRRTLVQSSAAWTGYGVPGSPYFVYVEDGVITGEGSSTTWTQVRDLMGQSVDDTAEARRRAGRPADVPSPPGRPLVGPLTEYADLARADRELIGAGLHPGHPSLYQAPDAEPDEPPAGHSPAGRGGAA